MVLFADYISLLYFIIDRKVDDKSYVSLLYLVIDRKVDDKSYVCLLYLVIDRKVDDKSYVSLLYYTYHKIWIIFTPVPLHKFHAQKKSGDYDLPAYRNIPDSPYRSRHLVLPVIPTPSSTQFRQPENKAPGGHCERAPRSESHFAPAAP